MTKSQQEALRSEGVNRHEWQRSPLGARAALCMHRAGEIGRLSPVVQKYPDYDDRNACQQQISENPRVGWMRDIPDEKSSSQLQRSKIEKVSIRKTRLSRRCLHQSVGTLHQDDAHFAGCACNEMMITPHCHCQHNPTHPTKDNVHLDIPQQHQIFTDFPQKKLEETHESFVPRSFAFFVIMN